MKSKPNLLIITDKPGEFDMLTSACLESYCNTYVCGKKENIFNIIDEKFIKIIILDSEGDESREFKLLNLIKTYDPIMDVIVVGAPLTSEKLMDWINRGATDYLIRPIQTDTLQLILARMEEKRNLKKETYQLEKTLEKKYVFQGMVGKSPFMLEVFTLIDNIAKYFSTVLITGDTGTGKEMVAKAIHIISPVKNRRFVVCDCASMPENLFESELFGYVKGAFTGADRDKKGLFEEAHEGVIFLDEIGEIPVSTQAKLLRVLENNQFRPVGSSTNKKVEVRVIAATNRNLREEIRKGTFREDLFHRLNKTVIYLPPLKSRSDDIPLLVRYFLDKYNKKFDKQINGVSQQVQKLFSTYDWPGNVRELENVIENAAMLSKKAFMDIIDLPKYIQEYMASNVRIPIYSKEKLFSLHNLEKEYITYIIQTNKNNIRKSAHILDISRSSLYEKIKKYQIPVR